MGVAYPTSYHRLDIEREKKKKRENSWAAKGHLEDGNSRESKREVIFIIFVSTEYWLALGRLVFFYLSSLLCVRLPCPLAPAVTKMTIFGGASGSVTGLSFLSKLFCCDSSCNANSSAFLLINPSKISGFYKRSPLTRSPSRAATARVSTEGSEQAIAGVVEGAPSPSFDAIRQARVSFQI